MRAPNGFFGIRILQNSMLAGQATFSKKDQHEWVGAGCHSVSSGQGGLLVVHTTTDQSCEDDHLHCVDHRYSPVRQGLCLPSCPVGHCPRSDLPPRRAATVYFCA